MTLRVALEVYYKRIFMRCLDSIGLRRTAGGNSLEHKMPTLKSSGFVKELMDCIDVRGGITREGDYQGDREGDRHGGRVENRHWDREEDRRGGEGRGNEGETSDSGSGTEGTEDGATGGGNEEEKGISWVSGGEGRNGRPGERIGWKEGYHAGYSGLRQQKISLVDLSQIASELLSIRPLRLNICSTYSVTSLLPIESAAGYLNDLSGAYNNDCIKELDEYNLQKSRARQNIQRHRTNNRRSSSFDLVPPNLSVCSKEYTEKKVHPRHRAVRMLPHSDVRLNHILPEDLNSTILTGHQIINPAKDSDVRGIAKDSSGALEKNNRTPSLASTSSLEQQYLQQQCQQLHLQQRQQQQQSRRHVPTDAAEESSSVSSTKLQMPVLSKKFTGRTSLPSMSNSMPSLKVNQKQPVEPHYTDPMVNCSLSFHQRVAELILLESDTIRWEKSKKTKKKPRDNS